MLKIKANCGCNFFREGQGDGAMIVLDQAQRHAETQGHIVEFSGTIEKDNPLEKPVIVKTQTGRIRSFSVDNDE